MKISIILWQYDHKHNLYTNNWGSKREDEAKEIFEEITTEDLSNIIKEINSEIQEIISSKPQSRQIKSKVC